LKWYSTFAGPPHIQYTLQLVDSASKWRRKGRLYYCCCSWLQLSSACQLCRVLFLVSTFKAISPILSVFPGLASVLQLVKGPNRRLLPFVDCGARCRVRCSLHSRPKICSRACGTCCFRCRCVPPGTYGNREMCGKCYTDMITHGNKPKCP
ncbi:Snakin-2, partial [Glycine soja]